MRLTLFGTNVRGIYYTMKIMNDLRKISWENPKILWTENPLGSIDFEFFSKEPFDFSWNFLSSGENMSTFKKKVNKQDFLQVFQDGEIGKI